MIVSNAPIRDIHSKKFAMDVGKPHSRNDNERSYWLAFHELVNECGISIIVNNEFYDVWEAIKEHCAFNYGGRAYRFWFDNAADRKAFLKLKLQLGKLRRDD